MAGFLTFTKEKPINRVVEVDIGEIRPNPHQPRSEFDIADIQSLADSILQNGILQPLTVRRGEDRYELIAGERRLRAAKLAGLRAVPCIILDISSRNSAIMALVENIQRQDLSFFDEASAIEKLITYYGMTQEDAAAKLGKAQSTIANKLRLLRLSPDVVSAIRENGLSERHARAVLKLKDEEVQLAVIKRTAEKNLSVKDTERLVEKTLDKMYDEKRPGAAPRPAIIRQVRDYRLFMNTVNSAIAVLRESGMNVEVEQEDLQNGVDIHIKVTSES